jgi:NADH-quinone oxidoreductase subunit N
MASVVSFLPMILAATGGAVALLLDAWNMRSWSVWAGVAAMAVAAVSAGWSAFGLATIGTTAVGGAYSALAAACFGLAGIALAASSRTLAAGPQGPRIAALSAFAAAAAALLTASQDLGVTFLAVEALALCGYGLVALAGTDRSREAAMKWFVQGSVATALMVVGIGVTLSATGGSLSYGAITTSATSADPPTGLAVGLVLVLTALCFKAGAFPFHSWMPDALETAPPVASAVLASAGKVGPIAAAVWLAAAVSGSPAARVLGAMTLLSVGSIVFGNLAALRQRSLARMLAYSAIAQIGYALAGLPMADGRDATLFFIALYGVTSASSFVFIVAMREVEPDWDGSIAGLAGLSKRHPGLAVALVPIMLSLTGIPLTAGFWGKFVVFGVVATEGYLWLALVAVLGSVVSFGYYGGVLRAAFLDDVVTEASATPTLAHGAAAVSTMVLAALIVVIGVVPLLTGLGVFVR